MRTFTIILLCSVVGLAACKKDDINTLSTKEVTKIIFRLDITKPYSTNRNSYWTLKYGTRETSNLGNFYMDVGTDFTVNVVSDLETLNIVIKTTDEVDQGTWHFTEVKNVTINSNTTIRGKVISTKPYVQFY